MTKWFILWFQSEFLRSRVCWLKYFRYCNKAYSFSEPWISLSSIIIVIYLLIVALYWTFNYSFDDFAPLIMLDKDCQLQAQAKFQSLQVFKVECHPVHKKWTFFDCNYKKVLRRHRMMITVRRVASLALLSSGGGRVLCPSQEGVLMSLPGGVLLSWLGYPPPSPYPPPIPSPPNPWQDLEQDFEQDQW